MLRILGLTEIQYLKKKKIHLASQNFSKQIVTQIEKEEISKRTQNFNSATFDKSLEKSFEMSFDKNNLKSFEKVDLIDGVSTGTLQKKNLKDFEFEISENCPEEDKIEMPSTLKLVKFYKSVIRPLRARNNYLQSEELPQSPASSVSKSYCIEKNIQSSRDLATIQDESPEKSLGEVILQDISKIKPAVFVPVHQPLELSRRNSKYLRQLKELQNSQTRWKKANELHERYNQLVTYIPPKYAKHDKPL